MKKIIALISILVLSGCSTTVPVKQPWPELPSEFPKECRELKLLEGDKVTLSKLMETVAANYGIYHECALHYRSTVEWYNKQRDIFNKAGN
jgi:hypothetical protein